MSSQAQHPRTLEADPRLTKERQLREALAALYGWVENNVAYGTPKTLATRVDEALNGAEQGLAELSFEGFRVNATRDEGAADAVLILIDTREACSAGRYHDANGVPCVRVRINDLDAYDFEKPEHS